MSAPDPTETRRRAERWDRLAGLFERASELDAREQAGFLDTECRDDPALRDELERLLREREPASFLEPPRASPRTPPSLFRPDSLVGKRIGAYCVLRAIATGGMGTVYEAEQERPHRRVALKVMLAGRASGTARRFRYEAEILARLKHPGIAQVYEAGIHVDGAEGNPVEIPWFAMEHVEGARTILEHARERDLDLGARLALVLEVCAAVGYGHEKGVIHRDLKPSNLLVDAAGRVKVIDYGVARARGPEETAETLVTRTGELVGTLQYMSPEQIEGDVEQLDVRSDVYAIGLVLYELLCGRAPYDLAGLPLSAVARKIRDELPASPGTWTPELPQELSWITLKALEKEPGRRYASALELADDLRRFLAHEPVLAGPPSTVYRLRKFVRRNVVGVTAAALVLAALVIGVFGLGVGMHQAVEARDEARQKTDDVLSLSAIEDLKNLENRADALWPPDPEMLPKYDAWIADARELIDGRPADPAKGLKKRPSLAEHQAKLAEIRTRAKPLSPEQIEADRRSSPSFAELETSRGKLRWMRRMLGEESWPKEPEVEKALANEELPANAAGLNDFAWRSVDLDPAKIVYGEEVRGLVLARRAVAGATGDDPPWFRDTLAMALYRCGKLDEALAEGTKAMEEEPEPQHKKHLGENLEKMRQRVALWRPGEARSKQAAEAGRLAARVAELEGAVSSRRTFEFEHGEDGWWHAQLSKLVEDLEAFTDEKRHGLFSRGISVDHGWGIPRRVEVARQVREQGLDDSEARRRWDEAIDGIAKDEKYHGLRIRPQVGLLPIGANPDSKLWEFAHLPTGDPAEQGTDGNLELRESTGLVFVLIPGGTFLMGAQSTDPAGPNYDPEAHENESPVHEVELSPFFLSKYEMTQGQWERFVGRNPSQYGPQRYQSTWDRSGKGWSALHPVEQVRWSDCVEVLGRLGLSLPTEAQWEYAARAGTSTPWWTGADRASLGSAANVADAYGKQHGNYVWTAWDADIDDGSTVHAAIGSYRANGFGLHEVMGNLLEWCQDDCFGGFYRESSKIDPVARLPEATERIIRGGGFIDVATRARCSARAQGSPEDHTSSIGVRPARGLRS